MTYDSADVLAHCVQVWQSEAGQIKAFDADTISRLGVFPNTAEIAYQVRSGTYPGKLVAAYTNPRLSSSMYMSLMSETGTLIDERVFTAMDFAGNVLMPLIGVSQDYLDSPEEALLGREADDMCGSAESYFADINSQVMMGIDAGGVDMLSVYHDGNGVPLLLRKYFYQQTAITLRPF